MKINGTEIIKPNDFTPAREDVYAGEFTAMDGTVVADRIGWKYSDLTLNWGMMPETDLMLVIGTGGQFELTFTDPARGEVTEKVIVTSRSVVRSKYYENGVRKWRDISMTMRFLNVNN